MCVLIGICAMSVGALRGLMVLFNPPELQLHTGTCELPVRVLGPEFSPLQDPSFPPCFSFPTHLHKQNPGRTAVRKGERIRYCCWLIDLPLFVFISFEIRVSYSPGYLLFCWRMNALGQCCLLNGSLGIPSPEIIGSGSLQWRKVAASMQRKITLVSGR